MADSTIKPVRAYEPVAPIRERSERAPGQPRRRANKPPAAPAREPAPPPDDTAIEPGRPGHRVDERA